MDSDIVLPWSKIKRMCFLMGYPLERHPAYFSWGDIGLKYIPNTLGKLKVVDKNKFLWSRIKYGF
jgi:hypothetical protein